MWRSPVVKPQSWTPPSAPEHVQPRLINYPAPWSPVMDRLGERKGDRGKGWGKVTRDTDMVQISELKVKQ